jgi:deoxyribonuclease V
MSKTHLRHRWRLTAAQALRLQSGLAGCVRRTPIKKHVRLVAGGDCAIMPDKKHIVAAWVVWNVMDRRVVEEVHAVRALTFPYVPGLLSFREMPALLAAARKLSAAPDVYMLDGQGLAHPRRFGLACHFGVFLNRPALGCAKSRLCGTHGSPKEASGSQAPLLDGDEQIGCVLRTRMGIKPIYVSVGHRMTLDDAVRIAMLCCTKYRIPEPTRLADQLVGRLRNETKPV